MNKIFLPTSRNFLPTFQTFCPLRVHFAQTVVHFARFQLQARKRGLGFLECGWGCFVYVHTQKGVCDSWVKNRGWWWYSRQIETTSGQNETKVGKSALELYKKNPIIFSQTWSSLWVPCPAELGSAGWCCGSAGHHFINRGVVPAQYWVPFVTLHWSFNSICPKKFAVQFSILCLKLECMLGLSHVSNYITLFKMNLLHSTIIQTHPSCPSLSILTPLAYHSISAKIPPFLLQRHQSDWTHFIFVSLIQATAALILLNVIYFGWTHSWACTMPWSINSFGWLNLWACDVNSSWLV